MIQTTKGAFPQIDFKRYFKRGVVYFSALFFSVVLLEALYIATSYRTLRDTLAQQYLAFEALNEFDLEKYGEFAGDLVTNYGRGLLADPDTLIIDIKFKHLQKLHYFRDLAIEKGVIETTPDSYVPADISYEGESYPAKIRLKGDYPNHLQGEKWSFRIKLKNAQKVRGMRAFSIQSPERSHYNQEWIMHQLLRYEDLIALRYDFVRVLINGEDKGIFALEESFSKELLEHNRRREAPILKFDESRLIGNQSHDNKTEKSVFYEADITSFNTGKTLEDEKLRTQFFLGRDMLNSLRNGSAKLADVIDLPKAAKLFAIMDMMGEAHALRWKNSRFYYNPVSSKLEMIGYNAFHDGNGFREDPIPSYVAWTKGELVHHLKTWLDIFFTDEEFVSMYFSELNRMTTEGYIETFFDSIEDDYERTSANIHKDGPLILASKAHYIRSHRHLRNSIQPESPVKASLASRDETGSNISLNVANIYYMPLRLTAIDCTTANGVTSHPLDINLATAKPEAPVSLETIQIAGLEFPGECFEAVESDGDVLYLAQLNLQFTQPGRLSGNIAKIEAMSMAPATPLVPASADKQLAQMTASGLLGFAADTQTYTIKPGLLTLKESLYFPAGYAVVFEPGARILLTNNADIISNSPFEIRGTEEQPVVIEAGDSTSGLAVISTNADSDVGSIIKYAEFKNLSAPVQGDWEPTSAITFYESNVTIANSSFDKGNSEDFLNVVRSDFGLTDVRFDNSFSDMIDVDFGNGRIIRGVFDNCGNDCIDLSGSVVEVSDVKITSAGDKGVSAGEASTLRVSATSVSDSNIGIASKDGSVVRISDINLLRNRYGLAGYQKKLEFSGSTIIADSTEFVDNQERYILETGSSITLENTVLPPNTEKFVFD